MAFQFCHACGAKNDNFVEKELVLHGGGKKPGWAKSISGLTSFSALLFLALIDSSCILVPNRKSLTGSTIRAIISLFFITPRSRGTVPDTEEEMKIADGVCNWLAAARKKSDAATSALSSAAPKAAPQSPVVPMAPAIQPAPQSPVVPASSAATPAAGSAEAQAAATEFDLDDPRFKVLLVAVLVNPKVQRRSRSLHRLLHSNREG